MNGGHDAAPRKGKAFFGFLAVCVALLAVDLVYHRHVVHSWEGLIGFYGLYGFVACVSLVLAARALRRVLMRDEDYWDA
jgi:hypothetical protein